MRRARFLWALAVLPLALACSALLGIGDLPLPDASTDAAPDAIVAADAGPLCDADTSNDPANCGACGSACTGTCTKGRCLVELTNGLNYPEALVVDSTYVYFTDIQSIGRVPIGGGAVTILTIDGGQPESLVIDATNVYWTNNLPDAVLKEPLNGGAIATLAVPNDGGLGGIAIRGSTLYFAAFGEGTITSVATDGGSLTPISSGVTSALAVAVDGAYVYWSIQFTGNIMKAPIGGGTAIKLIGSQNDPTSIAVDSKSVYFTNLSSHQVMRISLDGGGLKEVATGDQPIALVIDATHLYFTTYNGGEVVKVPLDGGPMEQLAQDKPGLHGIAVDSTSVYWTSAANHNIMKLTPK